MPESTIYNSDIFIKRLEHNIKKLSQILEQLDLLVYSAQQTCHELKAMINAE